MKSGRLRTGSPGETPVRGYLHVPANSSGEALVLTHGAGSNSEAPLLKALATSFCESGMTVLRCDLPFRQLRPQGPPPRGSAERDQLGLRRAVEVVKQKVSGRVFLGGHSYGGRQASILAASEPEMVKSAASAFLSTSPIKTTDRATDGSLSKPSHTGVVRARHPRRLWLN